MMAGVQSHAKDVHKSLMCKPECQFINLQKQFFTGIWFENSIIFFWADHGKLNYNQKIVATIDKDRVS